jgi:hypothetical protein
MIRKAEKRLIQQAGILAGIRHRAAYALAVAVALALAPAIVAQATERADRTAKTTLAMHANSFGEHVKRDAKAVGAAFKETAHRVGIAAKAVGHEIATAAKRSTAETRTAMRGEKVASTAPGSTR